MSRWKKQGRSSSFREAWPLSVDWLLENDCVVSKDEKSRATRSHVVMFGPLSGTANVRSDQESAWFRHMAVDIDKGDCVYFHEDIGNRNDPDEMNDRAFALFFDLDYEERTLEDLRLAATGGGVSEEGDGSTLDPDDVKRLFGAHGDFGSMIVAHVKVIQDTVARYYTRYFNGTAPPGEAATTSTTTDHHDDCEKSGEKDGGALPLTKAEKAARARQLRQQTLFAVICSAPPKSLAAEVHENGETIPPRTKFGVHLHFPHLYVTRRIACLLREGVKENLANATREAPRPWWSPWDDVVDGGVFTRGGLRMVFSCKCDPCPRCRNNTSLKARCTGCKTRGKVHSHRPYVPQICLNGLGEVEAEATRRIRNSTRLALEICHIRRPLGTPVTPGFRRYKNAPSFDESVLDKRTAAGRRAASSSSSRQKRQARKVREDQWKPAFAPNSPPVRALLGVIAKMNDNYRDLAAVSLTKNTKGDIYSLRVDGFGSRYCQNKGDKHNSSNVYFTVTQRGVSQKCWCPKKVSRLRGVPCSKYTSKRVPLPPGLRDILFEDLPGPKGGRQVLQTRVGRATAARLSDGSGVASRAVTATWIKARAGKAGQGGALSSAPRPRNSIASRFRRAAGTAKTAKASVAAAATNDDGCCTEDTAALASASASASAVTTTLGHHHQSETRKRTASQNQGDPKPKRVKV